jgi:hypothetical protein
LRTLKRASVPVNNPDDENFHTPRRHGSILTGG